VLTTMNSMKASARTSTGIAGMEYFIGPHYGSEKRY
jgi:hypothetical protein